MGAPYEIRPRIEDLVTGNEAVEVAWPHRSVISKILVKQLDGVGGSFTIALYSHNQVGDGVDMSDSDGSGVGKIPDEMFRVTPDLAATGGVLRYFSEESSGGYGWVFFSHQAAEGRQGQRASKLYVKFTGAAPGRYAILVGGMKEIE